MGHAFSKPTHKSDKSVVLHIVISFKPRDPNWEVSKDGHQPSSGSWTNARSAHKWCSRSGGGCRSSGLHWDSVSQGRAASWLLNYVQACCHPPGMVDRTKPVGHRKVWFIFAGKKPNLVIIMHPSGWQLLCLELLNLSLAQEDILHHSYIIYVHFWHWFSCQKMADALLSTLLLHLDLEVWMKSLCKELHYHSY